MFFTEKDGETITTLGPGDQVVFLHRAQALVFVRSHPNGEEERLLIGGNSEDAPQPCIFIPNSTAEQARCYAELLAAGLGIPFVDVNTTTISAVSYEIPNMDLVGRLNEEDQFCEVTPVSGDIKVSNDHPFTAETPKPGEHKWDEDTPDLSTDLPAPVGKQDYVELTDDLQISEATSDLPESHLKPLRSRAGSRERKSSGIYSVVRVRKLGENDDDHASD